MIPSHLWTSHYGRVVIWIEQVSPPSKGQHEILSSVVILFACAVPAATSHGQPPKPFTTQAQHLARFYSETSLSWKQRGRSIDVRRGGKS